MRRAHCPFVYAYEEHGHTFMGCMQKIFEAEIDVEMMSAARAQARRLRGRARDPAAAADVPLRGRPVLLAPRRRARLRQPRVQRAAGGIADVSRDRPLRRLGSPTVRSATTPSSGPAAATANARRHDTPATMRERRRRGGDDHAEERLLEAERGAARPGPTPPPRPRTTGRSTRATSTPAAASAGTSTPSGASTTAATRAVAAPSARPRPRIGRGASRAGRKQRPAAMRAPIPRTLIACKEAGGRAGRDAAVVVQEEDDERGDRDLRREEERGAPGREPHARVAERAGDVGDLRRAGRRRLAHEGGGDERAGDAAAAEHEERRACAACVGEPGEARRGRRAADRDRRLADAEREPAFARVEPAHDGAPARGVDTRAERAGEHEHEDERDVAAGGARGRHGDARAAEARRS